MDRRNKTRNIALAFILCGAFDFLWGYVHQHSVAAGAVAIVLGLFGTAWYMFLLGSWKRDD